MSTNNQTTQPNYIFYHDPGHGWLCVPAAEINAMHLAPAITTFSFFSPKTQCFYLEEDLDLSTFITARRNRGLPFDWDQHVTRNYLPNFKGMFQLPYHTPPPITDPGCPLGQVELVITQHHITQSAQIDCYSCPVGLGIYDALGHTWQYIVGNDAITIYTESWDPNQACYQRQLDQLPPELLQFITDHDAGHAAQPLTCLLTFPPGQQIPNRRLQQTA